jgi:hypothetical protein
VNHHSVIEIGIEGSRQIAKLVSIWEGLPRDSKRPTVSVVIPALNEERNLPHVAARMPHDIDGMVFVPAAEKNPPL